MKKNSFVKKIEYKLDAAKRRRNNRKKEKAIETLKKLSEDSYLVKKFKEEAEYAWGDKNDSWQSLMVNDVVEILSLISLQGDSGFSIGYKKNVLRTALDCGVFKPLTFSEDEFKRLDYTESSWQNKRMSSVFKDGDRYYDIDALNHEIVATYDAGNKELEEKSKGCWHGPLIMYKDGEFHYIETSIRNFKSYTGANRAIVPALEVKNSRNVYADYMFNLVDYKSFPKGFLEDYTISPKTQKDDDFEVIYCEKHKDELLPLLKKVSRKRKK